MTRTNSPPRSSRSPGSGRGGETLRALEPIPATVEALCRRVAVLHRGRIIACDALDALRRAHGAAAARSVRLAGVPLERADSA
ncbi:hypothetical protein [Sorangium sp. So ce1389]|uniref:hypothetical protein n=1 Tax=Sorangium sp. So ce1389 TaxID=3133336 RepID=UPI003F606651